MLAFMTVTTWVLTMYFQTPGGIKDQKIPGYFTEDACKKAGEKWEDKQPHKFDWFIATTCDPVYIVEPPAKGNDMG